MFSDLGTEKMTETEEIDQIRKSDSHGFANTDFVTFGKFVSIKNKKLKPAISRIYNFEFLVSQ